MTPQHKRILRQLEVFLSEPRKSERGGWAEITPRDMDLLEALLEDIIAAKCEKDADGDLPIEFTLVNRLTHNRLPFVPVPYDEIRLGAGRYEDSPERAEEALRISMLNLGIAHNTVKLAYDLLQIRKDKQK